MSRARLSVVIAATGSAGMLARCLESLGEPEGGEVIVVSEVGRAEPSDLRNVLWVAAGRGIGVPGLRALGLAAATAQVIVFTEDSCRFGPGWAGAWEKAFEDPLTVAATGPVEHASGGSMVDWAVFFCEYAPFLGPIGVGRGDRVAGNNFAARQDWLASRLGDDGGVHESLLPRLAASEGRHVVKVSDALVWHARRFGAREAIRDRFRFGLEFGRLRAGAESGLLRLAACLFGPLILASQVGRLGFTLARKKRHLGWFARSLPVTVTLLAAWSVGEWLGWVLGPDRAARRPDGTTGRRPSPAPDPPSSSRSGYTSGRAPV